MTDSDEIDRLRATIREQVFEITRLRAALQPLADQPLLRDRFPNAEKDRIIIRRFTIEDVRRAREALGRQP